jgi:DNA-binding NarL/FixJ family response regulator
VNDYVRGACPLCHRVLGFTKRQWSYLDSIHKGLSDEAIASRQGVTPRTAKSMIGRLRIQMGLTYCTRVQLILKIAELKEKLK